MDRPNIAQKLLMGVLVAAISLSVGIIVLAVPASPGRNALLALNWFLWLLFVALYPFVVVWTGKVSGTEPGSVSYRAFSPARYWAGFVATTLFWIAMLMLVSLYSFMAWHRGS